MPDRNYSLRTTEWLDFSSKVFNHIETYTVPQYGDKGSDQCSEFSESDFITQMKKYLNRYGKNSREGQQQLDLLKIAHYAGMLYTKLTEDLAIKALNSNNANDRYGLDQLNTLLQQKG